MVCTGGFCYALGPEQHSHVTLTAGFVRQGFGFGCMSLSLSLSLSLAPFFFCLFCVCRCAYVRMSVRRGVGSGGEAGRRRGEYDTSYLEVQGT